MTSLSVRLALLAAIIPVLALPAQFRGANGQSIGGISCDAMEGQRMHIHQHLTILDQGKPVGIPDDVGRPAGKNCLYWLHTHTPDGIIHVEAPVNRSYTLGDFFAIWSEPLSRTQVASARVTRGKSMRVWVDGKLYTGKPAAIPLGQHTDIVIEIGPPFITKPAPFTAWNGAN